jgi:HD-GYP domain-containing protein (c-di-GMP phosphodiesterase class II)
VLVKLTNEELEMIRNHPQAGVDLIQNIKQLDKFKPIIKYHHERYDGFGYPKGLKGEEIPYLARMLTIADSFDAITSKIPYNKVKTKEKAIEELRNSAGTQFDPILGKLFLECIEQI